MIKKHRNNNKLAWIPSLLMSAALIASPALAVESAPKDKIKAEAPVIVPPSVETGTAGSFLSSQFARQSGDVDAAILYLAHALEKNPSNLELASQLLSMQVAKGDMNAALATAKMLKDKSRADPLAELLITVDLIKKAEYATAGKQLNQAFDTASGQLWLPLVDAWIDAGKKQIKQPISIEEMPVNVGRAAAMINYHLALINDYAGFTDDAAINFSDAVEEPESAPLRIIQQLQFFIGKHRNYSALNEILARYKAAHPESIPPLESSIDSPVDGVAEVLYTMGSVMQMAGVKHDAAVYLQMTRYLRPDFNLATFALAELLIDNGSYARASAILAGIPPTSQYAVKAALRHGVILDRMGKTNEALAMLSKLALRDPENPDPLVAKGDLLRVHQRFLEASISYTDAIKRAGTPDVNDWAIYYARGACYERLERWNEAKADLKKSLELNPDQPDVLNYLAYGMLTRGEAVDEAKTMLEKAIAANPNDPQIIDSMGWALFMTGSYSEALPFLERAVELLPTDPTVNDHLGDTYWRLGRKNEARFQWERALTFAPEAADAQKINAKIASGLPEMTSAPATKSASASPAPVSIH